MKPAT
jgi:hypothetical protein